MIARWLRWERKQAAARWRDDARVGFALGLAIAAPVLGWLG